jgi:hypothetical protein
MSFTVCHCISRVSGSMGEKGAGYKCDFGVHSTVCPMDLCVFSVYVSLYNCCVCVCVCVRVCVNRRLCVCVCDCVCVCVVL